MVHTHKVEWKPFQVYLPSVMAWAQMSCGTAFCGISAGSDLEFHFTEAPSSETLDRIQAMWDQMNEEAEAAKISREVRWNTAIELARANLPYADPFTLSTAEKKIWLNQALTVDDKDSLLVKFSV